jgi:hypothetical protein
MLLFIKHLVSNLAADAENGTCAADVLTAVAHTRPSLLAVLCCTVAPFCCSVYWTHPHSVPCFVAGVL